MTWAIRSKAFSRIAPRCLRGAKLPAASGGLGLFPRQEILDRIDQSFPARFDNVVADPNCTPLVRIVVTQNKDAGFGAGREMAVNDPYLVVPQFNGVDFRVGGGERLAEGGVESVDWAIPFGDGVSLMPGDLQFYGGRAGFVMVGSVASVGAMVFFEIEERAIGLELFADQQFE